MIISFKNQAIDVPEKWNDLTEHQLPFLYGILMRDADPALVPDDIVPSRRFEMLMALTGWRQPTFEQWRKNCIVEFGEEEGEVIFATELDETCKAIATPFLQEKSGKLSLKFELTRNPFPEFKLPPKKKKGRTYRPPTQYGPPDGFEGLTFYELTTIFSILEEYMKQPDQKLVTQLLATIYRPGIPKSSAKDKRVTLSDYEDLIDHYSRRMERLSPIVRQLILFYCLSCRETIISEWPNLFKRSSEIAGQRVGNDYGYGGIIMALAGDITKVKDVGNQPWENVFTWLSYMDDERKRAEMKFN